NKREAKAWFETEFPVRFADLHNAQALGAWLYANITEDEGGRAVWRFQAEGVRAAVVAGRTVERWDAIERLRVPTLLVRGELSKDLPRSVYEKMQQMNPVIEGVELSGVGHWVHSEKFDEFVQVVELFLDRARQQSENR
ncbi:MAG: alpha/beta hydrolase, partial [Bdellovibrionales bacterium]|nr:alpha/beta hydrolase [Bdellovibrionales bacterium]